MQLWLRKIGIALYPDRDESIPVFNRMPQNIPMFGDVKVPRSQKFDGLFWTMCARIGEAVGRDTDYIRRALIIETGRFDEYVDRHGEVHRMPYSMAHHKMDALEFKNFFEEALVVIYAQWKIPPSVFKDLFKEINHAYPVDTQVLDVDAR